MRPWLIALDSCPSTNTWALEHADALAHGACIWTRNQTAGRGRNGSVWRAPPGVLTASFVLNAPQHVPQVALAAGLAVCYAVEDRCPNVRVGLKWPNDCMVNGRKLAGILCERADRERLIVGIGLNVDPHWEADPDSVRLAIGKTYAPTSIAEYAPPPSMIELLDGLRRYLLEAAGLLAADGWSRIITNWRERDALTGRTLVVDTGESTRTGIATGIDDHGRLTLTSDDGPVVLSGGSILSWSSDATR